MVAPNPAVLPAGWFPLWRHVERDRFLRSTARFRIIRAGRQSGKTEVSLRVLVRQALAQCQYVDAVYVCAAPTQDQARLIFWDRLKALVPDWSLVGKPKEGRMEIRLRNGSMIRVVGLDKPKRGEGRPLSGVVISEFAACKREAWTDSLRPALNMRRGWAIIESKPLGFNHHMQTWQEWAAVRHKGEFDAFYWSAEDVNTAEEIASLKASMDPATYSQEILADPRTLIGRAYYQFDRRFNLPQAGETLAYRPDRPLIFAFDFNESPGVAVVLQEHDAPERALGTLTEDGRTVTVKRSQRFTAAIGEVWIPKHSNTPMVCRRLCQDWAHHKGRVLIYGDATGGNAGSAKVAGSDWDLVKQTLRPVFANLHDAVRDSNPLERARVNAVNSRLRAIDGTVRWVIDSVKCPHLIDDLEGVRLVEGGSGEILKKPKDPLTHISDAAGYYIHEQWPIDERPAATVQTVL